MRALLPSLLVGLIASSAAAQPTPRWITLPPTPTLPAPATSGHAPVNGISIWYASFGSGPPVILLHGGLANSNYWGHQVPVLGIPQAAIVGWSDGAIIGLSLAMSHPGRVSRLFAFAANSDPSDVKDVGNSPVFTEFIARAEKEYEELSTTPGEYKKFVAEIGNMWATQPNWTAADLGAIKVRTWIVDADHDEAIKRENTEFMARSIPDAGLLLQPEVSHFSMLQVSGQFSDDVLRFLERKW